MQAKKKESVINTLFIVGFSCYYYFNSALIGFCLTQWLVMLHLASPMANKPSSAPKHTILSQSHLNGSNATPTA